MQYSYRIIANGAHVRMYTWYRYGNEYNGDANGTHVCTHGIDMVMNTMVMLMEHMYVHMV